MMSEDTGLQKTLRGFCLVLVIVFGLMTILATNINDLFDGDEIITDPDEDGGEDPQPTVEPYWIVAIGGSGRDYAPSFIETNDGFVAVGMTSSYGLGDGGGNLGGSHDFMAVKLDKKGNLIWGTTIGGPGDERGSYSVRPTTDGGYLLTGSTKSFGLGIMDLFIVKLNANGSLDWAKAIGGTGVESGKTTLQVSDGYITVGDTDSAGSGKKDILVVKLDLDGNMVWARAYGGMEDDKGSGIEETNGGYIIGATIMSYGAGSADAGLIKIDPQGNVLWAKAVGGPQGEGINWDGIRTTSDGGFAFGDATGSFGASGNQAYLGVKLHPNGDLVWSTFVDGAQTDAGWAMNETDDGFIGGGKYTIQGNGGDVLVVKFGQTGNFLWARTLGNAGLDEIEEIKQVTNGYVMAGVTRMKDEAGDFLVAKINTNGFVGGQSDPMTVLNPLSVFPVTPQITPFTPSSVDVTGQISVSSPSPTVTTPALQVQFIHKNN